MHVLAISALLLVTFGSGQNAPSSSSSGAAAPHAAGSSQPGVTMQGKPSLGSCRITGSRTTTIFLTVTPEGKPTNELVDVSSGDRCVDQQALKTVAGYHFNAATKNGQPVPTRIRIQVNYKPL